MYYQDSYVFQFPVDIERLIFEEAASENKHTATQLALVSRDVQQWYVQQKLAHSSPVDADITSHLGLNLFYTTL